jgi:hypothetical protein
MMKENRVSAAARPLPCCNVSPAVLNYVNEEIRGKQDPFPTEWGAATCSRTALPLNTKTKPLKTLNGFVTMRRVCISEYYEDFGVETTSELSTFRLETSRRVNCPSCE